MTIAEITATHLRSVFFGGNWTERNLNDLLSDVDLEEASHQLEGYNSIYTLAFHATYYVNGLLEVLKGNPLNTKDSLSFTPPVLNSNEQWKKFIEESLINVKMASSLIEQMPDGKLLDSFSDEKYGTFQSNILGIIEHTHYHLGQIVLIKKMIREKTSH